jgi:diadenosine tetraphosphate (Ap4A) HIT family hydrolase
MRLRARDEPRRAELALFWSDAAAVARSISTVLEPVKLDDPVMGHLCPHVHCHVRPQHQSDDAHALLNRA